MARRLPLLLLLLLPFVLAPQAAGDDVSRKAAVDSQLAQLRAKMAAASAREDALSSHISSVTGDIRALERRSGDVALQLRSLQADLELHRARLVRLTQLLELQTARLNFLRSQYTKAMARLDHRVVQLYKESQPSTLDVLVSSASFTDALDQIDYMSSVGNEDANVSASVRAARDDMKTAARADPADARAGRRRDAGHRRADGAGAGAPEHAAGAEKRAGRGAAVAAGRTHDRAEPAP